MCHRGCGKHQRQAVGVQQRVARSAGGMMGHLGVARQVAAMSRPLGVAALPVVVPAGGKSWNWLDGMRKLVLYIGLEGVALGRVWMCL